MDYEYELRPYSPYQEKYLNNESQWLICGGSFGCVDMDTEYLGEYGWKKISEYEDGEKINSYDPKTNSIQLETPEYVKEYGSTLYRFYDEYTEMVYHTNIKYCITKQQIVKLQS